jgi:hypothetical protein
MATGQVDNAAQENRSDSALPMLHQRPMAGLNGSLHTLSYVNVPFCLLTGKSKDESWGRLSAVVLWARTDAFYCLIGRQDKAG